MPKAVLGGARGGRARSARRAQTKVVIAGGGVAALELALALDDLAPGLLETLLIAPNREFVELVEPRAPARYKRTIVHPLRKIVRDAGAELLAGRIDAVDVDSRALVTSAGERIRYDVLVIAVGARASRCPAVARTLTEASLSTAAADLRRLTAGSECRHALLVPARSGWPVPAYELALIAADAARRAGKRPVFDLLSAERAPLEQFGRLVSDAVTRLLAESGVEIELRYVFDRDADGSACLPAEADRARFERVYALPELSGPSITGLPADDEGFLEVDEAGRVSGADAVFAVGSATASPMKHASIALQQADATATAIALGAGAPLEPEHRVRVLEATILTGREPLYFEIALSEDKRRAATVSRTQQRKADPRVRLRAYLAGQRRDA